MGAVQSPALQFVLASIPGTPSPIPTAVAGETTTSAIMVDFTNTNPDVGGSDIFLYELQMDDGDSGEFSTIFASDHQTRLLVMEGIERGRYYRFRYRVMNVVGYSAYSEVAYIQAVDVPETPARPTFVSATDTTITLSIIESVDSKGVDVVSYGIYLDAGNDMTSAFSELADYDGLAATYIIDVNDGLGAPGSLYRIKVLAKNEWDIASEFSEELVVALGSVPAAPGAPVKVVEGSGANEIAVDWVQNAAETLPVYGYRLYSDLGVDDEFSLIFDGLN